MLSKSGSTVKNDLEAERSATIRVAVSEMVKTKLLQASIDSLPVSTSKSSEYQYYLS